MASAAHLDPVVHGVVAHLEGLFAERLHDDLTLYASVAGDQLRRRSAHTKDLQASTMRRGLFAYFTWHIPLVTHYLIADNEAYPHNIGMFCMLQCRHAYRTHEEHTEMHSRERLPEDLSTKFLLAVRERLQELRHKFGQVKQRRTTARQDTLRAQPKSDCEKHQVA